MWHEARRREKVTQKLFSDHRKRAERRREEDRVDPNSLLQIHGHKAKLYPDLNAHKQVTKSLVSWQGNSNVTIDRFDVRATLTFLPAHDSGGTRSGHDEDEKQAKKMKPATVLDAEESQSMKKLLAFERYRSLMYDDLKKVPQQDRLKMVSESESFLDARLRKLQRNKFGTSGETTTQQTSGNKVGPYIGSTAGATNNRHIMPQPRQRIGAAISFNYNRETPSESGKNDESLSNIIDLDELEEAPASEEVDMSKYDPEFTNQVSIRYGLTGKEFEFLSRDTSESSTNDLIEQLRRLRDERRVKICSDTTESYGPDLPPEMLKKSPPQSANSSPIDTSPLVSQRSPSAGQIMFRTADRSPSPEDSRENECEQPGSSEHGSAPASASSKRDSRTVNRTDDSSGQRFGLTLKSNHMDLGTPKSQPTSETSKRELDQTEGGSERSRSRRATTPLAYKRHRRSSRSLSRERRSSGVSSISCRYNRSKRRRRASDSSSSSGSRSSRTPDLGHSYSCSSDEQSPGNYPSDSSHSSKGARSRHRTRSRSRRHSSRSKSKRRSRTRDRHRTRVHR